MDAYDYYNNDTYGNIDIDETAFQNLEDPNSQMEDMINHEGINQEGFWGIRNNFQEDFFL